MYIYMEARLFPPPAHIDISEKAWFLKRDLTLQTIDYYMLSKQSLNWSLGLPEAPKAISLLHSLSTLSNLRVSQPEVPEAISLLHVI